MNLTPYFSTYPHVVIYDTEFTTWEGAMERGWSGAHEHRELVQIAAQKIDLETEQVLDTFEHYVIPKCNPELSTYFVELTGITQADVATKGVEFKDVYEQFIDWSEGLHKLSYSCRSTDYSDADVLAENIALQDLAVQFPKTEFGNLCHVFCDADVDTTQYNSGRLYQAFGLALAGHEHNAMHDVHSLVVSLFACKRLARVS